MSAAARTLTILVALTASACGSNPQTEAATNAASVADTEALPGDESGDDFGRAC